MNRLPHTAESRQPSSTSTPLFIFRPRCHQKCSDALLRTKLIALCVHGGNQRVGILHRPFKLGTGTMLPAAAHKRRPGVPCPPANVLGMPQIPPGPPWYTDPCYQHSLARQDCESPSNKWLLATAAPTACSNTELPPPCTTAVSPTKASRRLHPSLLPPGPEHPLQEVPAALSSMHPSAPLPHPPKPLCPSAHAGCAAPCRARPAAAAGG